MKKLGHRGYSAKYPENTMLAFKKAIEKGFDGIETDVHLTKDGHLVLCHDEKIDRTSNGKGYIKDMTLEELKEYTFNNGKDYNESIPTLEELLVYIKDKDIIVNLEIKTDNIHYEGIERKIYDLVNKYNVQDKIIYSSFYLPSLIKMREIDNKVYLGYLYENKKNKKYLEAKASKILNIHPSYHLITNKDISNIREDKMSICVWTVPNIKEYRRLKELGVDITISNEYFED